jgi:hypothetical protein
LHLEHSIAAVIAGKTITPAQTAWELKWQKDASNNKNASEDFCKTIVAVDNRFVAFVYMVEGCYFLNLLHSIRTYYDIDSGDDVNNEMVVFVGDRTASRDPYAVLLTEKLPCDWKEFDVSMDAIVPEDWYKDTDNILLAGSCSL